MGVNGQRGARPARAFHTSSQESPVRSCIRGPRRIPRRICRSGIARRCRDRSRSHSHRLEPPTACQAGGEGTSGGEDQARTHHDRNSLSQGSRTRRDRRSRGRSPDPSCRRVSRSSRRHRARSRLWSTDLQAPEMSALLMGFRWCRLSFLIGLDGLGHLPARRCMPRRRPREA